MQNTWSWNPLREDREGTDPHATRRWLRRPRNEPPQSPHSLPEDSQPVDVSRDGMVAVVTGYNLS